ncbi:MAG: phosphodiester glycosidase family protein, partial [Candidatus Neomarinimicrobiota bacterium]|nr:phosphodiester glycosidase family protein [Candidatus Neomarinimicrobiota bacterium]
ILFPTCNNKEKSYSKIPIIWKEINWNKYDGIKILEGRNNTLPINAWVAIINNNDPTIDIDVIVSDDLDRKETLSQFSTNNKATVVVNGGYFLMNKNPTEHVGLLYVNNQTISPALKSLIRNNKRYFTARGALGFLDNGDVDIAWVTSRNDSLFYFPEPVENSPDKPVNSFDFTKSLLWDVDDAIHAGPVLMHNGEIRITTNEEVFFGSSIPKIHPRTAAGYRKNGELVLLVIDGRQVNSRGVDLMELAIIMKDLDCIEAINLDGGGSSAMVVDGKLINRPSGTSSQREVMSAIAISLRN